MTPRFQTRLTPLLLVLVSSPVLLVIIIGSSVVLFALLVFSQEFMIIIAQVLIKEKNICMSNIQEQLLKVYSWLNLAFIRGLVAHWWCSVWMVAGSNATLAAYLNVWGNFCSSCFQIQSRLSYCFHEQ